jgi:hypothetical protein
MIPITVGKGRKATDIDADHGVHPATRAGLAALKPVQPDGVVSYGSQTHPADGTAGLVLTTPAHARDVVVEGPLARVLACGSQRRWRQCRAPERLRAPRWPRRRGHLGRDLLDLIDHARPRWFSMRRRRAGAR